MQCEFWGGSPQILRSGHHSLPLWKPVRGLLSISCRCYNELPQRYSASDSSHLCLPFWSSEVPLPGSPGQLLLQAVWEVHGLAFPGSGGCPNARPVVSSSGFKASSLAPPSPSLFPLTAASVIMCLLLTPTLSWSFLAHYTAQPSGGEPMTFEPSCPAPPWQLSVGYSGLMQCWHFVMDRWVSAAVRILGL